MDPRGTVAQNHTTTLARIAFLGNGRGAPLGGAGQGGGEESGDIWCVIIASGRSQYNCRLVSQSCGVGRRWPKRDSVANICKLHVSLRRCLGSGFRRGLAGRRPTNPFASVGLGYLRRWFVVALPGGDLYVRPDPVVSCAQWTLGCATATARTAGLRPEKKMGCVLCLWA